jgi:hypothetical protein
VLRDEGAEGEPYEMGSRFEALRDVRRESGQRHPFGRSFSAVPVAQEFKDLNVAFRFEEFTHGPPH